MALSDTMYLRILNLTLNVYSFKYVCSFADPRIIFCPDIVIITRVMALRFLRNFGHLVTNLHIDNYLFFVSYCNTDGYPDYFYPYLPRYCSESLVFLSIPLTSWIDCCVFKYLDKPFPNLKMVDIGFCLIKEFPLNKLFPNLQILRNGRNQYEDKSIVKIHLPTVRHLSLHNLHLI